ncbi:hypothetical protein OG21DRAFT_957775 [Imleria badia]|nr:hypothetical protein OG21DRAFT_957775 [Imleria badia]
MTLPKVRRALGLIVKPKPSFEIPTSPPDPLYRFPHEYSFYAALAGTPGHTPWSLASATSEHGVTQPRRAQGTRYHTSKTRSSQAFDDSFTSSICRSTPSRRYLQVPLPAPLWEPDRAMKLGTPFRATSPRGRLARVTEELCLAILSCGEDER